MDWPARRQGVEQLADELYLPIYRYAYRLTGSSADAEDLVQEAFCKAQLRLHQLRDPAARKAWLFAILRNEYLHSIRDQAANRFVALNDVDEPLAAQIETDPAVSQDELQRALAELPEGYRTPVIMFLLRRVHLPRDRGSNAASDRHGDVAIVAGQGPLATEVRPEARPGKCPSEIQ